jgi:predicted  nucleic acid-binding Zn-ribbon protein
LNESSTASKRIKVLEQDLGLTLETVEQLQQVNKNSSKFERQRDALRKELVQLQQSSSDEKAHIEKGSAADR